MDWREIRVRLRAGVKTDERPVWGLHSTVRDSRTVQDGVLGYKISAVRKSRSCVGESTHGHLSAIGYGGHGL
jgi:hypothetical protein